MWGREYGKAAKSFASCIVRALSCSLFILIAFACSSAQPIADIAQENADIPEELQWGTALDLLRAGYINGVTETETDVVWFSFKDNRQVWSKRPIGHVWPAELRSMATFDRVIVD